MKISVLGSGSKGNAVYIESGRTSILIDCGFSGKELERRLGLIDRSGDKLAAICVTHEHNDHIKGVGVLSRRYGLPVYANQATLRAADSKIGKLHRVVEFETGDRFHLGNLELHSFRISHDTADPVGFLVRDSKRCVGCCTDTGTITHLMARRLASCDLLILEFNHDLEMLKHGPYPLPLKQRVRSNKGHLSNDDAASFLENIIKDGDAPLRLVIQAHLSETNNTAELAQAAAENQVTSWGSVKRITARQDRPTELFDV